MKESLTWILMRSIGPRKEKKHVSKWNNRDTRAILERKRKSLRWCQWGHEEYLCRSRYGSTDGFTISKKENLNSQHPVLQVR